MANPQPTRPPTVRHANYPQPPARRQNFQLFTFYWRFNIPADFIRFRGQLKVAFESAMNNNYTARDIFVRRDIHSTLTVGRPKNSPRAYYDQAAGKWCDPDRVTLAYKAPSFPQARHQTTHGYVRHDNQGNPVYVLERAIPDPRGMGFDHHTYPDRNGQPLGYWPQNMLTTVLCIDIANLQPQWFQPFLP